MERLSALECLGNKEETFPREPPFSEQAGTGLEDPCYLGDTPVVKHSHLSTLDQILGSLHLPEPNSLLICVCLLWLP